MISLIAVRLKTFTNDAQQVVITFSNRTSPRFIVHSLQGITISRGMISYTMVK